MNTLGNIELLYWLAGGMAVLGVIGLPVGLSLLFGTAVQRRRGLPFVWISSAALVTAAIILLLIWSHF